MRKPEYYVGRPVESLQTMLRTISDNDPRILPVIPNGLYGSSTYASVRSFQEVNGLPATGIADLQTWNSITQAYDQSILHNSVPLIQPSWSSGQSVRPGEQNRHVYLVQAMLTALSEIFSELEETPLTGLLDTKTQKGLQWVQHSGSLSESGELNTATWNQLTSLYRTMIGDGKI